MQAAVAEAPAEPAPVEGVRAEGSGRPKLWHNVAVRLADEGVPVRAIVRALMLPYDEVREVLEGASERGMILTVPRDDWPPGTRRDERQPDTVPLEFESEHLIMLAMRKFKLTGTEARMLIALLRRPELSKATLHLAMEQDESPDAPTGIKIVDVYVCKLRKKLPREITIGTIWGRGYCIPPEAKKAAMRLLGVNDHEFTSAGAAGGGSEPAGN